MKLPMARTTSSIRARRLLRISSREASRMAGGGGTGESPAHAGAPGPTDSAKFPDVTFLHQVMFLNYFGEEVPFEMYDINFCLPPGSLVSKRPASSYNLRPSLGLSALHLRVNWSMSWMRNSGLYSVFLGCKTSQSPEPPFAFFFCLLSTMTSVI